MTKDSGKGDVTVAGNDTSRPDSPQQMAARPPLSTGEIARNSCHLIMPEVGMDGQCGLKAAGDDQHSGRLQGLFPDL